MESCQCKKCWLADISPLMHSYAKKKKKALFFDYVFFTANLQVLFYFFPGQAFFVKSRLALPLGFRSLQSDLGDSFHSYPGP
jgi:hypothetical protein